MKPPQVVTQEEAREAHVIIEDFLKARKLRSTGEVLGGMDTLRAFIEAHPDESAPAEYGLDPLTGEDETD